MKRLSTFSKAPNWYTAKPRSELHVCLMIKFTFRLLSVLPQGLCEFSNVRNHDSQGNVSPNQVVTFPGPSTPVSNIQLVDRRKSISRAWKKKMMYIRRPPSGWYGKWSESQMPEAHSVWKQLDGGSFRASSSQHGPVRLEVSVWACGLGASGRVRCPMSHTLTINLLHNSTKLDFYKEEWKKIKIGNFYISHNQLKSTL